MAYQKTSQRKHVFAILGAGACTRIIAGMFSDPLTGLMSVPARLNVVTREADVLTFLNLDASRDTWTCAAMPPCQSVDPAVTVARKLDSGLNRVGNGGSRTREEAVVIGRIQRPNLSGFIKRDELIRLPIR